METVWGHIETCKLCQINGISKFMQFRIPFPECTIPRDYCRPTSMSFMCTENTIDGYHFKQNPNISNATFHIYIYDMPPGCIDPHQQQQQKQKQKRDRRQSGQAIGKHIQYIYNNICTLSTQHKNGRNVAFERHIFLFAPLNKSYGSGKQNEK